MLVFFVELWFDKPLSHPLGWIIVLYKIEKGDGIKGNITKGVFWAKRLCKGPLEAKEANFVCIFSIAHTNPPDPVISMLSSSWRPLNCHPPPIFCWKQTGESGGGCPISGEDPAKWSGVERASRVTFDIFFFWFTLSSLKSRGVWDRTLSHCHSWNSWTRKREEHLSLVFQSITELVGNEADAGDKLLRPRRIISGLRCGLGESVCSYIRRTRFDTQVRNAVIEVFFRNGLGDYAIKVLDEMLQEDSGGQGLWQKIR